MGESRRYAAFISYSSKDAAAASELCALLEERSVSCWMAPGSIPSGRIYSEEIMDGVDASDCMVVLISANSVESDNVLREVEQASKSKKRLIPVLLDETQVSRALDFHIRPVQWVDAMGGALAREADNIAAAVKGDAGWQKKAMAPSLDRKLRYERSSLLASPAVWLLVLAVVGALYLAVYFRNRESTHTPAVADLNRSPMTGTWKADLLDANGQKHGCVMDVGDTGWTVFSDSCPWPLAGHQASLQAVKDGVWAPTLFERGRDDGSFTILGGGQAAFAGAFKVDQGNHLITRDAEHGTTTWVRTSASGALKSAMDDIVPQQVDWPLQGVPAIAKKALDYVGSHWQPDARLMSVKAALLGPGDGGIASTRSRMGPVELQFTFYSPQIRQLLMLQPNSQVGMFPMGAPNGGIGNAVPLAFLDLPDAVKVAQGRGMRGGIKSAELQNWPAGTQFGDARPNGVEWVIDSDSDERSSVAAVQQELVLGEFCLDCANDRACFSKYNAILPGPRCNQLASADVRSCRQDWKATDRDRLLAARGACARILRAGRNDNLVAVIQDIDRRLGR
jgi:hypothetical protein